MKTSEFDFDLPETSIAAFPPARRDDARLMKMDRRDGRVTHGSFAELEAALPRRALVVLNESRVVPARLFGKRRSGGDAELLLLRKVDAEPPVTQAAATEQTTDKAAEEPTEEVWDAIGRHLSRLHAGDELELAGGMRVVFLSREEGGVVRLRLCPPAGQTVAAVLDAVGDVPIPPYIEAARRRGDSAGLASPSANASATNPVWAETRARERAVDRERYQTVYATTAGSVAAPTAGLHFTTALLRQLVEAGHDVVTVCLHVGLGTFRPVKTDEADDHHMDPEWYAISPLAAERIEQARRAGRPIVAVGTTVVRTLESAARASTDGRIRAGNAATRLYLRPGSEFQVVTDLLTNFHLPRSTLLMLVSAFAGRKAVLAAYEEAITAGYRFYSYGDAMFIRGSW